MQDAANTGTFTSKADEEFFGAIGRLTISWGHLELGLDCMVHILYHGFKGDMIEREIPRSLQRKITFLRSSWKRQPIGVDGINGYLRFLDRVQTAAQTRHNIIHGFVIEQAESSGEAIMVRVIRDRDGGIEKRRFDVTTIDILRAANEAQDLAGRALYWADEVHNFIRGAFARPPILPQNGVNGEHTNR
jgi:hypothetical protein